MRHPMLSTVFSSSSLCHCFSVVTFCGTVINSHFHVWFGVSECNLRIAMPRGMEYVQGQQLGAHKPHLYICSCKTFYISHICAYEV